MQFTTLFISLISLTIAAPVPGKISGGALAGIGIGAAAVGALAVGIPALVTSRRRQDRAMMQPFIPMGSVTSQTSQVI
jgi:hypothetical protein